MGWNIVKPDTRIWHRLRLEDDVPEKTHVTQRVPVYDWVKTMKWNQRSPELAVPADSLFLLLV